MKPLRILRHLWLLLMLAPISASAGTARIYVTNSAGDRIDVIDPATNKVVQQIRDIEGAHGVAFSPDGSRVYVSDELNSTLDVFDRKSGKPLKQVARILLPAAKSGFETDGDRSTAPSHGIGVAPDGKTLWVTSIPNNAVYVYSLADLTLTGEVALPSLKLRGHEPISAVANWVTFTPDGKTVYVSNAGLRSVSAIDTQSLKLVAVIPVGEVPKRINTLVIPDHSDSAATSSQKRASLH